MPLDNAVKETGRLGRREVFQGGGQSGREGGQEPRGRLLESDEAAQFPAQARHTLPHNTAGHDVIKPAHVRAETGNTGKNIITSLDFLNLAEWLERLPMPKSQQSTK